MTAPIYTFQRGEPVVIGQQVVSGDPSGYTLVAKLKPATGLIAPREAVESVADFTVDFVDAVGDDAAYWALTIAADDADDLPRGRYATDVQFLISGDPVAVTDPAFVVLTESVSG